MTNSIHPVSHRFESVVKNGIWVEEIQFSNFIAYQLVARAEARCWVVIYHLRFFLVGGVVCARGPCHCLRHHLQGAVCLRGILTLKTLMCIA